MTITMFKQVSKPETESVTQILVHIIRSRYLQNFVLKSRWKEFSLVFARSTPLRRFHVLQFNHISSRARRPIETWRQQRSQRQWRVTTRRYLHCHRSPRSLQLKMAEQIREIDLWPRQLQREGDSRSFDFVVSTINWSRTKSSCFKINYIETYGKRMGILPKSETTQLKRRMTQSRW